MNIMFIYRITKERFLQLSSELGTIFATDTKSADEVAKTFYFPYSKAIKSRKAVHTGGILYE